jgi:hypothetical protein
MTEQQNSDHPAQHVDPHPHDELPQVQTAP